MKLAATGRYAPSVPSSVIRISSRLASGALGTWAATSSAYLLTLLTAAALPEPGPVAPSGTPPDTVVLVPAHDEEASIGACVEALLQQVPVAPRVLVIADNCTDGTAQRAREAGAEVLERHEPSSRGKGQALAWALERLAREVPQPDLVGVVDADCLADPGLCAAWGASLVTGASAVQADYVISNPEASAAAARRWAGFALRHRIRGGGKRRLGLSAGLYGTGMAFTSESLRAVPWRSFSITEDVEHHAALVASGRTVAFTRRARVTSPAPVTERDARTQQLRWEAGNASLARRTAPALLAAGVRANDVQQVQLGAEQLMPPQSMLAASSCAAVALALLGRSPGLARLGLAAAAGQVTFVVGGLVVAGAPAPVWRSLATAPVLVAGKVRQVATIATGAAPSTWQRTAR